MPILRNVAQQFGVLEQARTTKSAVANVALRLRQRLGVEATEYRVPFDGRNIGFPLSSTHAKRWFERYQSNTQNGWHEPSLTRLLEVLAKDRKCLIDIGAHLGYFSALFASAPDRTAYSIELNPRTFLLLESTLKGASGVEGRTIQINAGLSAEPGEVFVETGNTSPTFSLVKEDKDTSARGRRVKITTLDQFCEEMGAMPDVIKIDVEGFERQVWRGGQQIIAKYRPILIVEVHTPQLERQNISTTDFIREIERSEYAVFSTRDHRSIRAEPFLPLHEIPTTPNFDILCVPKESDFLPDLGGLASLP